MNYYISDMHLFHANVTNEGTNFDGRPFQTLDEMHEEILKRWNAKINNDDDIYLLGDTAWKENEDAIALIAKLKGKKHAIKGNHCRFKDARYRQLFVEICDYKELTDNADGKNYNLALSHYPILMWNGQHKGRIHLFGHVHDTYDNEFYQKCLVELNEWYKERDKERYTPFVAYNVGAMLDYMDYTPRTLKEIIDANRIEM